MKNIWTSEIWRLVLLLVCSFFIGLLFGYPLLIAFIALLTYLILHLRALYKLERWLISTKSYQPPEGWGVWSDVYYLVYRSLQRQRKRKRLLVSYLNRFQELTKAMPDGTVVLRANGEIEWFNDAAQQLLGLRAPQDRNQRIDNLIRQPQFTEFLAKGKYGESLEILSPLSDHIILSVTVVPYGTDRRLMVTRDVTRLHRLEETRRDFVANVSHELRTPLTVINGYLETMDDMEDEDPLKKQWGQPLKLMHEQSVRMTNIVEDLLLLSRLETGQTERHIELLDVPSMVRMVKKDALALSGDKNHKIELNVDEQLWYKANQAQLFSVFTNLVFNAVRYTPAEGTIKIAWYENQHQVVFEVADTGVGISPQFIPRLTERFYRVDVGRSRDTGGTGLGLAIVKHILERHDARLTIESMVGKGSTFRCIFPVSRRKSKPASTA